MKIGIIVYSQTGNTASVAQKLKEELEGAGHAAQLETVTTVGEVKPGAKEIELKAAPQVDAYDALVFAAPVHAFSLAPAMKAYLQQLPALAGRKVACFVTKQLPFNWTGGNGAIAKMKKLCQEKGATLCGEAIVTWAGGKREQSIAAAMEKLCQAFK